MDIVNEPIPNTSMAADAAPEPNPATPATEPPPQAVDPPPAPPPETRSLRLVYSSIAQIFRDELVAHHSTMVQPGATTTYFDREDNKITRELTPRETMQHMRELQFFSKLNLDQQKLDAGLAEQNEEDTPKSLNDLVTPYMESAGDRMDEEALAQGLDCAAELPKERVDQIFQEEKQKYEAAHPPKPKRGRKKPFVIPPDERNDWFIPAETQLGMMKRLLDMALPSGNEYAFLTPRERVMASRQFGRFCALGKEQQRLDMHLHGKKADIDWDELGADVERRIAESLAYHKRQNEEFYKTHPRQGRPWRPQEKTEN
jgi:hypothetical protein